jgi:hypothetical protein
MYIKYACWQALIMACMRARRSFLLAAAGAMTLGVLPNAFAQYAATVVVYKSPTCGCCGEWEKHMRAAGFRLDTRPTSDMAAVKDGLGVPEALRSCHTATLGGYVSEGHVPAADVKRLLRERARVTGLAVPGMPVGAPGMEQGPARPYSTFAFGATGTRVFERH